METIQILNHLVQTLQKNPSVLSMIPWEDVSFCVTMELNGRQNLYPPETLESMQSRILQSLERAKVSSDAGSAITDLSEIADILSDHPDSQYNSDIDHSGKKHLEQIRYNYETYHTIPVIGDSHVNFFSGNEQLTFRPIGHDINTCYLRNDDPHLFTPLHLGPCLAYQCMNPDSTTGFFPKLNYLCEHFLKPGSVVILTLGEIDMRSHVFRHVSEDADFRPVVDSILQRYTGLLSYMKERGYQVCCWGPIATQPDRCPVVGEYPRQGSEIHRNQATGYYNDRLKAFCHDNDMIFMSVFYDMVDDNSRTKAEYLSSDLCHLGQSALPLAKKQWKLLWPDTP